MENNNNVLEIRGLNSYFFTEKGVAPAVDGLDLDIPKGKIIGLVGESGCGKSMTLRCIAGIVKPDRGRIVLDGWHYSTGFAFSETELPASVCRACRKIIVEYC